MVIIDLDNHGVNGPVQVTGPRQRLFENSIEATLFAGDESVSDGLALLPTLWCACSLAITVKHGEDAVDEVSAIV